MKKSSHTEKRMGGFAYMSRLVYMPVPVPALPICS